MSRQHHYLKIETAYFQAVERGDKKFEVRKNDRDFQRYDMVYLEEVVNGTKTGRSLPSVEIKYIMHGPKFGIEEGYCVFCW